MQAIRSSRVPLAYQLEGSSLVTSLPYADAQPEKHEYKTIKRMILEECEKQARDNLPTTVDDIDEDVDTPVLDAYENESLGKREPIKVEEKPVTRSEYEKAVIEIEQMKQRLIQLKVLKKNIRAVAEIQLNLNQRLKEKLDDDLAKLIDKCNKVNESRKYAQVGNYYDQESLKEHLAERKAVISALGENMLQLETKCEEMKRDLTKRRLDDIYHFNTAS